METFPVDRSVERYLARRVVGWEQRDGAVVLQVEGVRASDDGQPDVTATSDDQIEVAVAVLESGALHLTVGLVGAPRHLDPDSLARLAVTTTAIGLHLASERQTQYGPDPENVRVEIRNEPLALVVLDAAGRTILVLDAGIAIGENQALRQAPLAWTYVSDVGGLPARALPRRSVNLTLPLEPDEHLYGFDAQAGPLDRVGTTRALDPRDGASHPLGRFLLSSRGYGLFVHTEAPVTADLGASGPAAATLTVDEATLNLFLFPATWPRTALAGCAAYFGRAPL